jgi:hypothetical protein
VFVCFRQQGTAAAYLRFTCCCELLNIDDPGQLCARWCGWDLLLLLLLLHFVGNYLEETKLRPFT